MAGKAKYMKRCQILAEMTTRNTKKLAPFEQLKQKDRNPGDDVAIIGNPVVLAYPLGIRKGCNLGKN